MADITVILSSTLATSLSNLDSKRCRTPSQHVRKEEWTEVFGNRDEKTKGTTRTCSNDWQHEMDSMTNEDCEMPLRLYQFRPSFQEQLVLRITKTPHLVFNSSYASTETTGPLPYLLDLDCKAMIGKRNPGDNNEVSNIVSYLTKSSTWHNRLSKEKEQLSHLYTCMLEQELNVCLRLLRYGDSRLWDDVYKEQCIFASLQPNAETKGPTRFFNPVSSFQAWSERAVALKKLRFSNEHLFTDKEVNIDSTLKLAKSCYQTLDSVIAKGNGFLLGAGHLTLVDSVLFQHLSEALCDIHLVRILAEYKHLVSFFQNTYEAYFGKAYLADKPWVKHNNFVNKANQFNRIPLGTTFTGIHSKLKFDDDYKAAIQIMQSIAMHCFHLEEVLASASIEREREEIVKRTESKNSVGKVLKRVRMGGEIHETKDDSEGEGSKKMKEEMKKRMKTMKEQDELWISSVVGITILGFLFATANASK